MQTVLVQPESASGHLVVEFLIEPFTAGDPGPHVTAALSAFAERNISVDLGPFASTAVGPAPELLAALSDAISRATQAGATNFRVQVASEAASIAKRDLHRALPDMIKELEAVNGAVDTWDRGTKQEAVRELSERGAFLLRGSTDDVAEALGVSRITIYNYLSALGE